MPNNSKPTSPPPPAPAPAPAIAPCSGNVRESVDYGERKLTNDVVAFYPAPPAPPVPPAKSGK